jgi:tetratricopeptide (TPR) repeat protein
VGDVLGESLAATAKGATLTRLGRLSDANEATSHASDLARAAHSANGSAQAALGMADIATRRGEFELAAEWLNDAARLYAALRDEPGRATVSLARAILSFEQDGIADARQIFRAVAARAVDLGIPWMELAAHAGAALCTPDGRPPELDARWGRVNELLAAARPDWWFPGRERVDVLAIRVALAAGHVSVAIALFDRAVELADARDVWASCWLVAQVGDALVAEGLPAARATLSVAARRAAECAFAPLAQRLSLLLAAR